jgi:hypothetical protein
MKPRRVSSGFAVWLLLASAGLAARAQAQPSVRIRAGTAIELDALRQGTLHGRLLDDLGEPIADRVVLLELLEPSVEGSSRRIAARSDEAGAFAASISASGAALHVRASFAGDRERGPAQVERTIDRTRAEVQLRFVEPRSAYLDLAASAHGVLLRASSPLGGAGLALTLRDERGRTLGSGVTGEDGGLRIQLVSRQLGEPGAGVLEALSAADDERAAGRVALPIVRFRHTVLSLHAERESDLTRLHGALHAGAQGLAGKAIGLFDGNRHVTTVLTDRRGSFRYEVAPQRAGRAETWQVQARFASDAAWLGSSRSPMIALRIEPLRIPSALWLLLPALGLGAIAVWLLRSPTAEPNRDPRALPVGIHAERGRSASLGSRRDVAGSVRDARTGRAIAEALIELSSPTAPARATRPERDGAFRTAELEPGIWRLTVSAPGYGQVASELSIPHRGQWADVQVRLPNLRDAALEVYRPVALNRVPSAELWGRWTAREVLASAAQAGRSNPALERVTALVERIAYGPNVPAAHDLVEIERASQAALDPFGGQRKADE